MVVIKDGVAELTREELLQYAKGVYRSGRSPGARGVGLAVLALDRLLAAAEAKLAKALDLAEKIELQRQTAESREKALREAALELCVAAAEAFVVRGGAGMAALPALVARVRSLIPGEIGKACDAALAAGKDASAVSAPGSCPGCHAPRLGVFGHLQHEPGCRLDAFRLKAGDRFETLLGRFVVTSVKHEVGRVRVKVQDEAGHQGEVWFYSGDVAWPVGECPHPPELESRPTWAEWRRRS